MAGIRKVFEPDVKANMDATKIDRFFMDIPKDQTVRVRIMPIIDESGLVFVRANNHYKMIGENGKGTALACLEKHGNVETGESCYLCELARKLAKFGDKAEAKIGKSILCSPRWYTQVLVAEETGRDDQDQPILKYTGPKLLGLPKTGADAVNTIMNNMRTAGQKSFTHPDEGQDLFLTRYSGTPWYSAERSGVVQPLVEICPEWEDKIMEDVPSEIDLKVVSREEQRQAAVRAFGDDLDWTALAEEYGL